MSMTLTEERAIAYAGDLNPQQAWEKLQGTQDAILIDVRTQPEWVFSGIPNIKKLHKEVQTISWKIYPTMELNTGFVAQVSSVTPTYETPILFLCKTGGRSADAASAMAQAGYSNCYNIAGGFEGDRDDEGRRGLLNGWKAAELPWEQA